MINETTLVSCEAKAFQTDSSEIIVEEAVMLLLEHFLSVSGASKLLNAVLAFTAPVERHLLSTERAGWIAPNLAHLWLRKLFAQSQLTSTFPVIRRVKQLSEAAHSEGALIWLTRCIVSFTAQLDGGWAQSATGKCSTSFNQRKVCACEVNAVTHDQTAIAIGMTQYFRNRMSSE